MIRLGFRLTLGSGRDAAMRVLVTAAAVALGVGLLLVVLAGMNGLNRQSERGAWLDTSAKTPPAISGAARPAPLWWLLTVDEFASQSIDRVDVAATGRTAPVPPGIPRLPGPGQYYASPALEQLMASTPRDELADRFPGHLVGTIGPAGLPSPSSLIVVIGHRPGELSGVPGAVRVGGIQRTLSNCDNCESGVGSGPVLRWILAGGAVALLLPVLILIAMASRLSATRREERLAAMRLVGATPRQVSVISAVEAMVAAVAGVAVGFALFFLFRPLLAHVAVTGAPFAPGDLSLGGGDVLLVVIGVPLASLGSARLAMRRARISPLGVSRRASSAPLRAIRLIPLAAGIAELAYFDAAGKPGAIGGQLLELLVGFVLIVAGLVLAAPWFTTAGARLMAERARRPAILIAGRRLLDNPRTAFRYISGLVLALFVTSAAVGALSSVLATRSDGTGVAGNRTIADLFCGFTTTNCPSSLRVRSVPANALAALRHIPGVNGVTVIHQSAPAGEQGNDFGVVACDELSRTPALGRCARGARVATIGYFLSNLLGHNARASTTIWPTAHLTVAAALQLPVDAVVVAADGSPGSLERARTALEERFPFQGTPTTIEALDPSTARLLAMVQDMTDLVIVASLIIAACSLAVNIAAGLGERKRPFSLLRLTGVPTGVLRGVVALESAVPLLMISAVSVVVGLVSAALYLHSQVGIAFRMPGIAYWATVLGGLGASLAIIASTLPLLSRITGPEIARND